MQKMADRRGGRFFMGFAIAVIAAVCFLCLLSVLGLRRITEEQTEKYLSEFSASVKQLVEERIEYTLNFLETEAVNYSYNRQTDGAFNLQVLQERAEMMDLTHIIVLDADGTGVSSDGLTVDYRENPYIMQALQGERVLAPADELHYTGRGNEFLMAVPVYEGKR